MTSPATQPVWRLPDDTQLPCEEGRPAEREWVGPLLDDTMLPCEDGTFVHNDQEHPQSMLLTDSLLPVLRLRHPDDQFCIGQDLGIYWREAQPPERGAVAPDWFLVLNVPRTLDGRMRRSYVLWLEVVAPLLGLEFVSGDGSAERDRTRGTGKFWIYEQALRVPYYGIYEVEHGRVEVQRMVGGHYEPLAANARGHFEIPELGVELGIWQGRYQAVELPWLRWWDTQGQLLLTGDERAEQERQRTEQERQRAERLAAQLRAAGIEPEA